MKASLTIVLFFAVGIAAGLFALVPFLSAPAYSEYSLYILMFLVGVSVAGDPKTFETLKHFNIKILLVPLCVVVGSLIGGGVVGAISSPLTIKDGLLISAGFGYYSLSSILITKFYSESVGVIALLANIGREVMTLIFAPLLARHFGKLAPIAAGGATSMDTTLPVITLASGKRFAIISVFSGVLLTVLVPFLVTFLISL